MIAAGFFVVYAEMGRPSSARRQSAQHHRRHRWRSPEAIPTLSRERVRTSDPGCGAADGSPCEGSCAPAARLFLAGHRRHVSARPNRETSTRISALRRSADAACASKSAIRQRQRPIFDILSRSLALRSSS